MRGRASLAGSVSWLAGGSSGDSVVTANGVVVHSGGSTEVTVTIGTVALAVATSKVPPGNAGTVVVGAVVVVVEVVVAAVATGSSPLKTITPTTAAITGVRRFFVAVGESLGGAEPSPTAGETPSTGSPGASFIVDPALLPACASVRGYGPGGLIVGQ